MRAFADRETVRSRSRSSRCRQNSNRFVVRRWRPEIGSRYVATVEHFLEGDRRKGAVLDYPNAEHRTWGLILTTVTPRTVFQIAGVNTTIVALLFCPLALRDSMCEQLVSRNSGSLTRQRPSVRRRLIGDAIMQSVTTTLPELESIRCEDLHRYPSLSPSPRSSRCSSVLSLCATRGAKNSYRETQGA